MFLLLLFFAPKKRRIPFGSFRKEHHTGECEKNGVRGAPFFDKLKIPGVTLGL
jgi:hypothetical protein